MPQNVELPSQIFSDCFQCQCRFWPPVSTVYFQYKLFCILVHKWSIYLVGNLILFNARIGIEIGSASVDILGTSELICHWIFLETILLDLLRLNFFLDQPTSSMCLRMLIKRALSDQNLWFWFREQVRLSVLYWFWLQERVGVFFSFDTNDKVL